MSSEKKSAFVNVDELTPQLSLEQVAAFYGVALPELKCMGAETRAACFLNCCKAQETGDSALAIEIATTIPPHPRQLDSPTESLDSWGAAGKGVGS